MSIPAEMQALVADAHGTSTADALAKLRVATIAVPRPRRGQVLVRMHAAPCNPADLLYMEGRYGIDRPLPATPGFEGAGVVVENGGGLLGRWMLGKRVACGGHRCSGTWAEYCLVDSNQCVPLRKSVTLEQGATAMANPITAFALVDLIQRGRHRAYVQTAAASQLGKILLGIAAERGITGIHVVRRATQADVLRELGAKHVLVSSDAGFVDALTAQARELGATIALDAVAGAMTGQLVAALPKGSEVVIYGALSNEPCSGIDPMVVAFQYKRIRGFEIADHLRTIGLTGSFRLATAAQKRVSSGGIVVPIRDRFTLAAAPAGLAAYASAMSEGKVLITPNPE